MTDESILARVAAGDKGVVAECLDRYGALVWSLVRARIRNAADAEDAAQEIFVDLWKSAARYDSRVASEAVFIATIARRRVLDRLRAVRRRPLTEQIDEQLPLASAVEQSDLFAAASDVRLAAKALAELESARRSLQRDEERARASAPRRRSGRRLKRLG